MANQICVISRILLGDWELESAFSAVLVQQHQVVCQKKDCDWLNAPKIFNNTKTQSRQCSSVTITECNKAMPLMSNETAAEAVIHTKTDYLLAGLHLIAVKLYSSGCIELIYICFSS